MLDLSTLIGWKFAAANQNPQNELKLNLHCNFVHRIGPRIQTHGPNVISPYLNEFPSLDAIFIALNGQILPEKSTPLVTLAPCDVIVL